jgi:hypothetical protein
MTALSVAPADGGECESHAELLQESRPISQYVSRQRVAGIPSVFDCGMRMFADGTLVGTCVTNVLWN